MNKKHLLFIWLLLTQYCSYGQALRISNNGRYIETEEHKPFLWIGDTAWELFHKLRKEEAFYFLEKRKKQGFNVIQAVILSETDGLRTPNAYGQLPFKELDPTQPNIPYFELIDAIVNKAKSLGIYMVILPTWADKVPNDRPGKGPVIFNNENAAAYGSFLAHRYPQKNVIWMLGGDRNVQNQEAFDIWKAMAVALRNGNSTDQLITYHPAGEQSSSKWFQNENWIDFNVYQSGHAHRFMPVYQLAKADYFKTPVKPSLDAEPAYEDIPVEFWAFMDFTKEKSVPDAILDKDGLLVKKEHFKKGFFTDYDVRVHAYWNLLSGACGYTYGHNSVWQMFRKGDTPVIPTLTDWTGALDRSGANQMRHLKKVFTKYDFSKLVPDEGLISGQGGDDSTYIASASAADDSYALVYLALGQDVVVKKGAKRRAWWFDPRTGIKFRAKVTGNVFTPPSSGFGNDWLLILEK
ncbi:glycoside hydrolase family 140 protein [Desertivirga arenae]|uniref:glycoside hydrolase family 140 protein n=1 Tax=Desertivirga arenae TaxID=2810309 RepID=UPI001A97C4ED|nr:glycoside hydrolase family 140 protein [Pedobacter sp. SYSU D00823]